MKPQPRLLKRQDERAKRAGLPNRRAALASIQSATTAAGYVCEHCGLPVGTLGTQRLLNGTTRRFCCYGCCLAWQVHHGRAEESESVWLLIRLGTGAFLAMNIMALSLLLYSGSVDDENVPLIRGLHIVLWALATPVLAILGGPFLRDAWQAARAGRATADTLIALGALAAYGYSAYSTLTGGMHVYFDTATMLLVVFTLGRYLEAFGRAHAARSLEPLLQPGRQPVTVLEPDGEVVRHATDLAPGAVVRVRPGERIGVDGIVLEGTSSVDEAILTGEDRPVRKTPGSSVLAGSLNHHGPLLVRATASGSGTRWGRICAAVQHAMQRKGHIERAVDRASGYFVPAVLAAAGISLWYWSARLPFDQALLIALSVLVVACPCALGLAAPLATTLGLAQALRRGCLVRGGAVLEALAGLRLMAFDKTGTLTTGKLRVAGCASEPPVAETELLRRAASLEQGSEHPLATAIVTAARHRGLRLHQPTDVRVLPGQGIAGRVCGEPTVVGHAGCLRQLGWPLPPELAARAGESEHDGHTIVYVGWGGRGRGLLMLADRLRHDAADTIAALHRLGIATVLLTGDRPAVAARIARAAGIERHHAGLSPESKLATLRHEARHQGRVAMVGDGLNDGPVLAGATVGIAVGGATDLARETADVVLPADGLAPLPWLVRLARHVRRAIITNLAWAFGYNLIALLLAVGGWLQPVLAAGLMAGSSLLIVIRTLRIDRRSRAGTGPDARRAAAHQEEDAAPLPITTAPISPIGRGRPTA